MSKAKMIMTLTNEKQYSFLLDAKIAEAVAHIINLVACFSALKAGKRLIT